MGDTLAKGRRERPRAGTMTRHCGVCATPRLRGTVRPRARARIFAAAVALAGGVACGGDGSTSPFGTGDDAESEAPGNTDGETTADPAVGTTTSGADSTGAGDVPDPATTTGDAPADTTGEAPPAGGLDACQLRWDFTGCPGEWETGKATATAPGDVSWACGDPPAAVSFDGTHTGVWATNLDDRYNDEESSYLLSPSFDLSSCGGATVYLAVAHTYEFGGGDGGTIQLSVDGGSTWTTAEPTWNGYCPGVLQTVGEPSGEPGFCDGDYEEWTHSLLDLASYAGEPDVRIRFVFGSDSILEQEGWYIDSVAVEAYP